MRVLKTDYAVSALLEDMCGGLLFVNNIVCNRNEWDRSTDLIILIDRRPSVSVNICDMTLQAISGYADYVVSAILAADDAAFDHIFDNELVALSEHLC